MQETLLRNELTRSMGDCADADCFYHLYVCRKDFSRPSVGEVGSLLPQCAESPAPLAQQSPRNERL